MRVYVARLLTYDAHQSRRAHPNAVPFLSTLEAVVPCSHILAVISSAVMDSSNFVNLRSAFLTGIFIFASGIIFLSLSANRFAFSGLSLLAICIIMPPLLAFFMFVCSIPRSARDMLCFAFFRALACEKPSCFPVIVIATVFGALIFGVFLPSFFLACCFLL